MCADIMVMASGFEAIEGPAVDEHGNLYFSDLRAGGVHRLLADGRTEVVVPERPAVGGICLHARGGLVVSGRDLSHIWSGGSRVLLTLDDVGAKPGAHAVGFNDIHADRAGRVFAGVLRRDQQGQPVPGELLWVTAEHEYTVVDADVYPNGAALSPDGGRLYLADTFRQRLIVFAVSGDDPPVPLMHFSTEEIPGLPDGIATDEEGFVWVAFYRGGCVARFSPSGRIARVVDVPAHKALSLCFGGADGRDLYVVTAKTDDRADSGGSIVRMSAGVRGTKVDPARI
jgi:gluconolactonase